MSAAKTKSKPGRKSRILLVDDHRMVLNGYQLMLDAEPNLAVCATATSVPEALAAVERERPDLVVTDLTMAGRGGLDLIKDLLALHSELRVLVCSMHDETLYAERALRAGAKGYVMKQQAMDNVLDALRRVIDGGVYVSPQFSEKLIFKAIHGSDSDLGSPVDKLSDRELEVLQHFGRGKTTREVAETLHLSVKTIETHRAHIKEKLGFKDADELVKFAVEWMTAEEG